MFKLAQADHRENRKMRASLDNLICKRSHPRMTQYPLPPNPDATRRLERLLGNRMRARLPEPVAEFVMFVLKQGWACLFGILMLAGLIISAVIWQPTWAIARYDALFVYAVSLQVVFLWLRLESWREVRVIALFHLTGTLMELFKVNAGSWGYPEPALLKLAGVPLFSGFMYAAVGSYMARVIRIFEMRFAPYPPFWMTLVLAMVIYVNFFSHHYLPDIRLAAFLSSFFLWLAENIGTNTGTWVYAGQVGFDWVSLSKMGSWYLLLYVSFATVTLIYRDALSARPLTENRARSAPRSTGQMPGSG